MARWTSFSLHLIEDDDSVARDRTQLKRKRARVGQKLLVTRLVQKVDDVRARERFSSPRALADSTDPEEEEASLRRCEQAAIGCNHVVIMPCKMTA
jgi:hypothetical protein